MSDLSRMMAVW